MKLAIAVLTALTLLPAPALAQPICYMVNNRGQTIDLSGLCAGKPLPQIAKTTAPPVGPVSTPLATAPVAAAPTTPDESDLLYLANHYADGYCAASKNNPNDRDWIARMARASLTSALRDLGLTPKTFTPPPDWTLRLSEAIARKCNR